MDVNSLYASPRYGLININKFKAKKEVQNVNKNELKDVITNNAAYQIHNQAKPHYFHIAPEPSVYQADIMFFPESYKRFNSNYNSILNIIEIGTRLEGSKNSLAVLSFNGLLTHFVLT